MIDQEQILISDNLWHHHTNDISSHSEKNIQVGFFFDTMDPVNNVYLGWMIDEAEIWGCNVYGTIPMKALAYARPSPVCETNSYLLDGTGTYARGNGRSSFSTLQIIEHLVYTSHPSFKSSPHAHLALISMIVAAFCAVGPRKADSSIFNNCNQQVAGYFRVKIQNH